MKRPEDSLEDRLKPRLRLFLSADIVGSTAYKNQPISNPDQKAPPHRVQPWLKTFNRFYEDLPRSFNRRYQPPHEVDGLKVPRLWKTLGDEIVFETELAKRAEAEMHLTRFCETVEQYRAVLVDADPSLSLKGTAWVAGFPVGNSMVKLTDAHTQDTWEDFIGPSMDIGFRLKDFASPRRIAISIELAYVLASGQGQGDDGFRLYLADAIPLKGVINRKPYPAFWIESKGAGDDADLDGLEQPLRSPAPNSAIHAFCQRFIEKHSPPLFHPFIEGDPCFCRKPDGYQGDHDDISATWRDFTSAVEPPSDQDAGPRKSVDERLADADELQPSSE